jgi:thermitase
MSISQKAATTSYSQFSLSDVKRRFGLTLKADTPLFAQTPVELRNLILQLILALSALTLLLAVPALAQEPPTTDFIPGEILVKFQPQVELLSAQASLRTANLPPVKLFPRSRLVQVAVEPGQEAETIRALLARGDVEVATYNHPVQAQLEPSDPEFSRQWGSAKIGLPAAWELDTGQQEVIIAILDTGVDLDHPDLQDRIITGYDFINNDDNADDDNGHGTHVAGIAAASANNGMGGTGVSWGARIMPLKVLDAQGNGDTADVAEAIYYAVDHEAKVINLSLGAFQAWPCDWPEIEMAFEYAVNRGAVVVAASGNHGRDGVSCPAAYEQAIAVGATTESDFRASFSNYGSRLDLVAPGSSIYSTLIGGGYGYKSGTSMATPYVSGLAALLWSFSPSLSGSELRDTLQSTATDLEANGWDTEYGWGRIDAFYALTASGLWLSPSQTVTLTDHDRANLDLRVAQQITATLLDPEILTWTAKISPEVTWLEVSAPVSGTVSSTAAPIQITLVITSPPAEVPAPATIVVTGITSPTLKYYQRETQLTLNYSLLTYLPLIIKP